MFQKGTTVRSDCLFLGGCLVSVERMFLLVATVSFVVLVGATALLLVNAAQG